MSVPPAGRVVGIDLGGTKTVAALVGRVGACGPVLRRPSPGPDADPAAVDALLEDIVAELTGDAGPAAVGIGAAGFVDPNGRRIRFAPHLPWRDDPLAERLELRWGVPVALDNDANCAAEAELATGVARGVQSAALVTVGTGIGGALVLGGRVLRGHQGMAGEFGHVQAVPDGLPCECGLRGCVEQYVSGRAVLRAARDAGLGPIQAPDGPAVTALARAGDPTAVQVLARVGQHLGVALAGITAAFDPELLVVGGGVADAGDLLLGPARDTLASHLVGARFREVPPVLAARSGAHAGLVGAGLLAHRLLD